MSVEIRERPFDPWREVVRFQEGHPALLGKAGATAVFVGSMRDFNESQNVHTMTLEHYPGMTEKQIETILQEAASRWDVQSATVIHRVGELCPGEQIVFVGVASAHRGDAFDACEYIIDYLKTRATFWKKEKSEEGTRWLETRQSDIESADAWTKS